DDLWGLSTEETNTALAEREGKGAVAMSIGPAGENRVLFANVVCGGTRTGAAGRGGLGAVMGSKRLKALVASGGDKPDVAFPDGLKAFLRAEVELVREKATPLTTYGTPVLVEMINEKGLLCTHNAAVETFASASALGADAMAPYIQRNTACPGCPIACGKTVATPSDDGETVAKMPEYETIYALGTMLDMTSIAPVIEANALCDRLGLDTISMGVTLAFVAECLERGVVTEEALGGGIGFDDADDLITAVQKTARRDGIGDLLAEGSVRLAERFGKDADRFVYAVKGLEIAGHSARGLRSLALGYATSTRGGSHHDTRPKYLFPETDPGFAGQPAYSVRSQNFTALGDSLVLCRFVEERLIGSENNDKLAELVNLVTDWGVTSAELEAVGERIYNLERRINVRRGAARDQDTLPWRSMNEPIPDGPAEGRVCPPAQLAELLDEYYVLRGWDANGRPTVETLTRLGLGAP
ncbi:MAG: aldehyde ferredoxin oxidoreductase, partial [Lentisphaerae bacterium]|nr:aldehyde ferredoxin oxidoreductase [Lentisphaerota bacterium]